MKHESKPKDERDRDDPVSIPLDPEEALRGLLKTPPEPDEDDVRSSGSKPRQP